MRHHTLSLKLPTSFWLLSVLFLLVPTLTTAQLSVEYHVKAVFLFRFAQFVEWPPIDFATPQSPIILGVLGTNPFADALPLAIRGETINGRRVVVKNFRNVKEMDSCHVLFISRSEAAQVPAILNSLKDRSILSVSLQAAESSRLRLSSQLLKLSL